MIETNTSFTRTIVVSEKDTALAHGSGDMPVLATPAMVALMENAAMNCVKNQLNDGDTTVGAMIETTHLKPSKVGTTIRATATVTNVDDRKLTFCVEAYDGETLIGKGTHIRYIVTRERFLAKLK